MTGVVAYPGGTLQVMAEPTLGGRSLVLDGLHLNGSAGANGLSETKFRLILQRVMERMDVDEILVRGATQTTGANLGRRPGNFRFRRKPTSAAG
jgi:hypothetical protein